MEEGSRGAVVGSGRGYDLGEGGGGGGKWLGEVGIV